MEQRELKLKEKWQYLKEVAEEENKDEDWELGFGLG